MFLDDKLIQICKESEITSLEDAKNTIKLVYQTCNDYLVDRISIGTTKMEALATMNRSFKLFDSFVEKLKNHGTYHGMDYYGYFKHKETSWKEVFLSSECGGLYEECLKYKYLNQ